MEALPELFSFELKHPSLEGTLEDSGRTGNLQGIRVNKIHKSQEALEMYRIHKIPLKCYTSLIMDAERRSSNLQLPAS